MTETYPKGRAVRGALCIVLAPVAFACGVIWSFVGGPYLAPLLGFLLTAILVSAAGAVARDFGQQSRADAQPEPPWFVALTPSYLRWLAELANVRVSVLKYLVWCLWAMPAGFFLFLVAHAIYDLAGD